MRGMVCPRWQGGGIGIVIDRAELMKRTLERLGAQNTEIHIADASEYRLEWKRGVLM